MFLGSDRGGETAAICFRGEFGQTEFRGGVGVRPGGSWGQTEFPVQVSRWRRQDDQQDFP